MSNALDPTYSRRTQGDLEAYLREHDGFGTSNQFRGYRYFPIIMRMGIVRPGTGVRVSKSPAPDTDYFVNDDFMLESNGEGEYNMSCTGAPRGVYNPREVLRGAVWSIGPLFFNEEEQD